MKKLNSNLHFRKQHKPNVLKIAHGGGTSHVLGNTMEAFNRIVKKDIDLVEFDVHYTKDHKIVIMHDHNIKKTTDGVGLIKNLSLKEIKRFHKLNGERVPTLQEVFDILKGKCICKIDIKDRFMEKRLLKMIKKNHIENSVILTSEVLSTLKKIKRLSPKLKISLGGLKKRIPVSQMVRKAKSVKADIIDVHYSIITKKLVEEAHKNQLNVHVWTVDDKETIKKMKRIGVDGITSNFPDRI